MEKVHPRLTTPIARAEIRSVFNTLNGAWTFVRHIAGQATLEGSARFTAIGPQTRGYEEEACVRMVKGSTHRAWQRYVYVCTPGGFEVWFAQQPQRRFHAIDLHRNRDHWVGEATHMCGGDSYDSCYRFAADGHSFELRHVVSGPRKDYISTSAYTAVLRGVDQRLAGS